MFGASTQLLLIRFFFFFNDTATTEIYTLSLHDALPISRHINAWVATQTHERIRDVVPEAALNDLTRLVLVNAIRSEEHTSELQSLRHLVCRLLLEKKNNK